MQLQVCGALYLPQFLSVSPDDVPCNNASEFCFNARVEPIIYRLSHRPFCLEKKQQFPCRVKHDLRGQVQTRSVARGMGQRKLSSFLV